MRRKKEHGKRQLVHTTACLSVNKIPMMLVPLAIERMLLFFGRCGQKNIVLVSLTVCVNVLQTLPHSNYHLLHITTARIQVIESRYTEDDQFLIGPSSDRKVEHRG